MRRSGDEAPADHLHAGQAAGASSEQAHPFLRPGGDRLGRDQRGRDSGGRHRRRGQSGRRGWLDVGPGGHLPAAGGSPRAGPRRPDRPRVPGRRGLRHVPRRQPLQQDLGDFVARFEAQRSRATAPRLGDEGPLLPARKSCWPTSTTRSASGWRSWTNAAGPAPGRKAGRPSLRPGPGRRVPLRPQIHEAVAPSSRPGGASSRSPTPSSG